MGVHNYNFIIYIYAFEALNNKNYIYLIIYLYVRTYIINNMECIVLLLLPKDLIIYVNTVLPNGTYIAKLCKFICALRNTRESVLFHYISLR